MDPVRGLEALPPADGPTVVTVGFFDGVHVGHRAVLGRAVEEARARRIRSVAVTFDRHPREILTPGREPRLLTTVERKAELIASTGIDMVVVLEFTEAFSHWPAQDFISKVLVEGLRVQHAVVGADFTFGFKALGTPEMLIEVGPAHGFTAERVELVHLGERRVSSSSIREALGIAYFRITRWREAEAEFRKLVELSPVDGYAHYALGRALQKQGRHDEAAPFVTLARMFRVPIDDAA